jgi:hypothetical protein
MYESKADQRPWRFIDKYIFVTLRERERERERERANMYYQCTADTKAFYIR